jgi:hypothetical protein
MHGDSIEEGMVKQADGGISGLAKVNIHETVSDDYSKRKGSPG